MKLCRKCNTNKELNEFCLNKRNKDGLNNICRICKKEYNFFYKEKIVEYQNKTKDKRKIYNKEWVKNNRDKYINNYNRHNKNKTTECIKINNEKQKEYKIKWNKERYKNNINYKISQLLRIRLICSLRNDKGDKKNSISIYLGCSINGFKKHIETQFKPEMNWENHGDIWELDHILPCSSFNLELEEEQKKCFHYTNHQPLFKTTKIAESFGYINEIGNRNKINKY